MAITSDGNKLYVCMGADDKVAVVDLRTNTITAYITVGTTPSACELTPDNSRLYVANYDANTTSIINTNTNTAVGLIGGNNGPCDIVFNNDASKVFILYDQHFNGNANVGAYTVTDTPVSIGSCVMDHKNFFGGLDIEPGGSYVWVCDFDANEITAFSTSDYTKLKDVALPATTPGGVVDLRISNDKKIYVGQDKYIRVYDINSGAITANITTIDQVTRIDVFNPSDTSATVSPQLVTFTAKTGYRTLAVTGLNVSVYDNSTGTLQYSGVTDSTGSVNFVLTPTTKYNVLFNQSPNINTWYYVTPTFTGYIVDIPFGQVVGLTSWSDMIYNPPGEEISWKLAVTYNTTTGAGSIAPTYNDTGTVNSVTFSFYQNATSFGGADILLENQSPVGSGSWTFTENLASATGNNYYVIITVVKPSGTFSYVSGLGYTFPGPKVLAGVFPSDWYFWLAWGICLCFYGVGTVTKKGLFAIFGAVIGFILAKWGWYSLVFPDVIAYTAIGFTFIIAVVVTLIERERYT
jgi:YVTN family beta-propeller protein